MRSKNIICLLFIVCVILTGCKKEDKPKVDTVTNQDDTQYVYIIYTLDKEYRIGLDKSFTARDIGTLAAKFKDVNVTQMTQYILDDNKEYLENKQLMTIYVDTKEASYYNQCIVQIAALINSSYSNYNVEYLNIPKENTFNNSNDNEQGNQNKHSSNSSSSNNGNSSNSASSNADNSSQSSNSSRTMLPTISYVCPSGYEITEGKCIKRTTYNATKQATCPDGYNYDESKSKCLKKISKPPIDIVYCNNGYPVKDGDSELYGGSGPGYCLLSEEMVDANYGSLVDECPSILGRHCTEYYNQQTQQSTPIISCPDGSTMYQEPNTYFIQCQKDNNAVEPTSISCGNGGELYGSVSSGYYCEKIENTFAGYMVRTCSDGRTLIKYNGQWNKCALIEQLNYGIYCDDEAGEEMISGECISYQEQTPTTKYQCNQGDESYNTSQCIYVDSVATTPKYSCPNKYVLTVEYMCIER